MRKQMKLQEPKLQQLRREHAQLVERLQNGALQGALGSQNGAPSSSLQGALGCGQAGAPSSALQTALGAQNGSLGLHHNGVGLNVHNGALGMHNGGPLGTQNGALALQNGTLELHRSGLPDACLPSAYGKDSPQKPHPQDSSLLTPV